MRAILNVEPGDTYSDFLAREGGRTYSDQASGVTFTLRDLYAMAGIDPQETVVSAHEAALPLEGLRLRLEDLETARITLNTLLDSAGLERWEREHAGAPVAATKLPAYSLSGLGSDSTLGERLEDRSIGDVAAMARDELLELAVENVPEEQRNDIVRQARDVWARARRVNKLVESWSNA